MKLEDGNNGNNDVGRLNQDSPSLTCSICGKPFHRDQSKTLPFCSVRCQQIDLGNWLGESYGLPVESGEAPYDEDSETE